MIRSLDQTDRFLAAHLAGDAQTLARICMEVIAENAVLRSQLERTSTADDQRRADATERKRKSRRNAAANATNTEIPSDRLNGAIPRRPAGSTEDMGATVSLADPDPRDPVMSHVHEAEVGHVTSRDIEAGHVTKPIPFSPTPPFSLVLTTTGRSREVEQPPPADPDIGTPELLVAAVNRGLRAKYGEHIPPVLPDQHATEAAALADRAHVELDGLLRFIERKAKRCRHHPQRMAYFVPAIADYVTREAGRNRVRRADSLLPPSIEGQRRVIDPAEVQRRREAAEKVQDAVRAEMLANSRIGRMMAVQES